MECQTTREGVECFFWTKSGCGQEQETCQEISEKCDGCSNVTTIDGKKMCKRYPEPSLKWLFGACNMATHVKEEKEDVKAVKINPLKASKRMARGR